MADPTSSKARRLNPAPSSSPNPSLVGISTTVSGNERKEGNKSPVLTTKDNSRHDLINEIFEENSISAETRFSMPNFRSGDDALKSTTLETSRHTVQGRMKIGGVSEFNLDPTEIEPGVFIGEGKAKSGEKFYLRMEKITEKNEPYWEQYINDTGGMANDGRSKLAYLISTTEKVSGEDGSVSYRNDQYGDVSREVGYSHEEFGKFISFLGAQGFISGERGVRTKKAEALLGSQAAYGALAVWNDGHRYILYASKTCDFSIESAAVLRNGRKATLKDYIDQYSDLLMCVGSNFSGKNYFENRGIFRQPYSAIENTYRGISMILHGFSGAVAEKFFKKEELLVRAISSMEHIICTTLERNDYRVKGMSHEEALKQSERPHLEFHTTIKVDALKRFYSGHTS